MIPYFLYGSGMYRKYPNHTYGRNRNISANNWASAVIFLTSQYTGAKKQCSSFWLLGFKSRDFSQAQKERTACKFEQIHKMTTIFAQNNKTILSESSCQFVNLLSFASIFFSQHQKNQVTQLEHLTLTNSYFTNSPTIQPNGSLSIWLFLIVFEQKNKKFQKSG